LHDREPLPRWSRSNTTLLGDACHPMVPFMAQGACQALEDAAALTDALSQHTDVTAALDEYEQRRRPRTADIQGRSFANATTYHLPDGEQQAQRDAVYTAASRRGADGLAAFDWLYGHAVSQSRASRSPQKATVADTNACGDSHGTKCPQSRNRNGPT
ncbi:MAG: FAD-dependent monooxygenase, partial [Actinomycetota bacterium]